MDSAMNHMDALALLQKAGRELEDAKSEWEDANNTLHDARRKYESAWRDYYALIKPALQGER